MRYPDGTYDLTVDDIHEIRENTSKITEKMTFEELKKYYDDAERDFYDRCGSEKLVLL